MTTCFPIYKNLRSVLSYYETVPQGPGSFLQRQHIFLMPEIHSMHVKPSYFALLKSGDKLVEFRLNDAKRKKISTGDKIRFICQSDLNAALELSVSDIITSSDFSSLLKKLPLDLLGGISYEDQLADLRNFYNIDSESKYGAIAIILKGLDHAR